jgi:TonB-dependent starch-binding outer membrane protein SusC
MVKKIANLFTLMLLIISIYPAIGQTGLITGTVTDMATGETLPGASVLVKGTTTGTVTNMEGRYEFTAPVGNITLEASFIGYEKGNMEVSLQEGQTVVANFALYADITTLEEFIVIGYGVQKRSDMTGSVVNITAADMNQGVLQDPIQGLQGKAAGVMITKQGSDPNAGFSVRIRGASALQTNTDPLYVVDGVPGVDPTTIASHDIESFNVLKDASAAAIYGSRGANGVIIITTKRGQRGESSKVDFSSFYSFDQVAKRLDLLSADELRDFASRTGKDFFDAGHSTNWQDEVFRTGASQNYSLAFSGGENNLSYRASVAHESFMGVVKGSEKERTTARLNVDHRAFDEKLILSAGLSGTFENNEYIAYDGWGLNQVLYNTYARNPTDPVLNENQGFYEDNRGFNYRNPVGIIENIQNSRNAKRYFGYLKGDLTLFEGLVAGVNLAYTRDDHENFYFEPSSQGVISRDGEGNRRYSNSETRLIETTLRYNTVFNLNSIEVLGGYSFQEDRNTGFFAQGRKPYLNYIGANDLSMFQEVIWGRDLNSEKGSNRLISFFSRAIYNYDSKYYLTGTLRRDGSSKFGKNNEWGWFPSGSVMWNLTNEDFLSNNNIVNNLRLRAGIGLTGNQEFDNYLGIEYYHIPDDNRTTLNFETGEDIVNLVERHEANPDLRWESNREINIGVDFGLFNDRISGSVEAYQKNTYDLLGEYSIPVPPASVGRIYANVGEIQVQGIDAMVQAFPVSRNNLEWRTNISFSTFTQDVISLSNDKYEFARLQEGSVSGPGLVGTWTQVVQPGMEIGTWFMPEFAAIQNGVFLFYTETGGVTRNPALAERRVVGSALPDFELGWSNYLQIYNNLDLSFTFRGVFGHDVYNATKMIFGNPGTLPALNGLRVAIEEHDKGLSDSPKVSSYYLEDGTFIRLDNISLGYNIRGLRGISNVRLYVASNNVFTLTRYTGLDPEISFKGRSFGLDQFNVYPKTRTFIVGLNLSI